MVSPLSISSLCSFVSSVSPFVSSLCLGVKVKVAGLEVDVEFVRNEPSGDGLLFVRQIFDVKFVNT